jgi:hypothetical protein
MKRRHDSPEQELIAKDVLRKHEKALRELAKQARGFPPAVKLANRIGSDG